MNEASWNVRAFVDDSPCHVVIIHPETSAKPVFRGSKVNSFQLAQSRPVKWQNIRFQKQYGCGYVTGSNLFFTYIVVYSDIRMTCVYIYIYIYVNQWHSYLRYSWGHGYVTRIRSKQKWVWIRPHYWKQAYSNEKWNKSASVPYPYFKLDARKIIHWSRVLQLLDLWKKIRFFPALFQADQVLQKDMDKT